jgi:hypothetical protein
MLMPRGVVTRRELTMLRMCPASRRWQQCRLV